MNETTIRWLCMIGIGAFLIWGLIASFRRTDDARGLAKKWIWTLILVGIALSINIALFKTGSMIAGAAVPIFTALFAIIIGIIWASSLGEMLASPLTNLFSGGSAYDRATPIYGIAEARRKRGLYEESIAEVKKQLAKFPGDLTGTMMLVDLYAKDMKQMGEAQEAVESYLNEGPHPAKNTFLALAHLADAYITHDSNRAQAKQCLERIQTLCEGTEQEMIAAQRLAHLTTDEQLEAKHKAKRVHLQPYERGLGLRSNTRDLRPKEKPPEQIANEYIQQLNEHPLDLETRENRYSLLIHSRVYRVSTKPSSTSVVPTVKISLPPTTAGSSRTLWRFRRVSLVCRRLPPRSSAFSSPTSPSPSSRRTSIFRSAPSRRRPNPLPTRMLRQRRLPAATAPPPPV